MKLKFNKFNIRSIRAKLMLNILLIVLVISVGISFISYRIASSALANSVNESFLKITQEGAKVVYERVTGTYKQLSAFGNGLARLDMDRGDPELAKLLDEKAKEWGYLSLLYADMNGKTTTGLIIATQEFFRKAAAGQNTVSDPVINKAAGTAHSYVAVPVKDGDQIEGVLVAALDGFGLSDMIADVTYAKTGRAFIKNKDGITIAHTNKDNVMNKENIFEQVKTDPSLKELAALEERMCNGEKGTGKYRYKGETKYMGFTPIGIEGWSIALAAPDTEVLAEVNALAVITFSISAAVVIISVLLVAFIASSMARPIKQSIECADKLAHGDLSFEVPGSALKRRDETGDLARAIKRIADSLNRMLSSISSAAVQVASGAKQVSDSSAALSHGAAEQASSIEELSASVDEISAQTNRNAEHAEEANRIAETARQDAEKSSVQMQAMLSAMDEINRSSNNISKIIKVIDDIAFQTNILALNAAVEAARAGQYGKGFAVVAEEVRNLAARSANAAKETTDMIEGSIKSVQHGAAIAKETSDTLGSIVGEIQHVANLVSDITKASNEQAAGIVQISQGVSQVSTVIQSNSAISEESAASSEEMSSQAHMLEEQVRMFKLRKDAPDNSIEPEPDKTDTKKKGKKEKSKRFEWEKVKFKDKKGEAIDIIGEEF